MNDFKNRLNYACNKSVKIPEFGQGQQITIARELGVSQEAVRKWFAGLSKPRPRAMKALAAYLDVPYVWLSLGTDHEETAVLRDVASRQSASLYVYVAYVISKGGSVAFNKGSDDTSDVTTIIDGEVNKVSVFSPVEITDKGEYVFRITAQSDSVESVCACRIEGFNIAYDFIKLDSRDAKRYAEKDEMYVVSLHNDKPNIQLRGC